MSAALDFHLVGWLAREKDRAARIEDFVATLKQLHEDLDWPKPSLDLKLNRRGSGNYFVIYLFMCVSCGSLDIFESNPKTILMKSSTLNISGQL